MAFAIGKAEIEDIYLSLSSNDNILTRTRQACNQEGLGAVDCGGILKVVLDAVKSFVEKEGYENL